MYYSIFSIVFSSWAGCHFKYKVVEGQTSRWFIFMYNIIEQAFTLCDYMLGLWHYASVSSYLWHMLQCHHALYFNTTQQLFTLLKGLYSCYMVLQSTFTVTSIILCCEMQVIYQLVKINGYCWGSISSSVKFKHGLFFLLKYMKLSKGKWK